MTSLAPTMQAFFTERLAKQLQASPRTVISYRDTFRLLLSYVQNRTGKAPSALGWNDLSVETITAFLDHLEADRRNSPAAETPAWRRCARCSAMPPSVTPSTHSSSGTS